MEIYLVIAFAFFIILYFICAEVSGSKHVSSYEKLKVSHLFYCKQCNKMYQGDQEVCKCPECGKENSYLRF